ncbi:hypothetical protein QOZ80_8BG0645030 [Eleusine coracana subsp. coracana]|nr:hypothetical protein QOZ80_8BG0645030 [Eleusine coracana subsp. coracana]
MKHAGPTKMTYKQLEDITDGFSNERILGSGSYGVVYKGIQKDGHKIAVKLLHGMQGVDDKGFIREFNNLTKLKHENIVQFVGFCNEAEEVPMKHEGKYIIAYNMRRALCFEYMNNGNLQRHLFQEQQGLDWQKRYKIIKGICEGLKHLHTGLQEGPVYHLDLKPDNILLDTNMVPKIADFGLSRLLGEDNTKKTINSVGTRGYCPPEFVNYQIISTKFDIFSLGVIIIKIICGAEGYYLVDGISPAKFIKRVHQQWKERFKAIQGYTSLQNDCRQVKKCLEIALKCIEQEKERRPNIVYIIDQLNETEKGNKDTAPQMEEVASLKPSSRDVTTGAGRGKGQVSKRIPPWATLPKEVTPEFLKNITDNFSKERIVGESVFGRIYKGTLPEGGEIAVKMTEHFICYEYLPMGSLDRYIYDKTSSVDWHIRFKVTKGICEGLHFLHRQLDGPLIHMNLVPNSIWLDNNWVPKITNFELSRLFGKEQTQRNTVNVMGLIGYMAPEYLYLGEISTKSDIYSLGMLILEITTGDKNVTTQDDRASRKFVLNVHENWNRVDQITARYPLLDANGLQQVKTCIEIGLCCVELDRDRRPSIVDIINKISAVDGTNRHSMGKDNNNASKVNTSRQIKCGKKFSQVLSVDVHPAEPWIMTSHHTGEIFIWDFEEQEVQSSFDFAQKPVYSAKFIEREEWIVAGDGDGTINVYSYITDEEVASIQAHDSDITTGSVHRHLRGIPTE